MDILGTVTNAVLLILVGGLLSWQLGGRFKAVDDRFKALETRLDSLQRSVDGIRSDLTQVALAVGMKRESGTGA